MKHIALFVFIFFFSEIAYTQTVNSIVNNSLKALKEKDYTTFEKEYPKLYLQFVKENEPNYIAAIKSVKRKEYEQAFEELEAFISEGYMLDEIKTDINFQKLHPLEGWDKFISRIDSIIGMYNNVLRKELNQIQYKDQGIRILLLNVSDSLATSHPTTLTIRKEMKRVDSISSIRVQQIVDEYGWLGDAEVGSEASQTLFLAIQHVDDLVVQEKYLPILEKAVREKRAEPWQFAFLTDRVLMNQGKRQIYGTQVVIGKTPSNSYVVPLQNPERVDELRKNVGLESLNEYLQEYGIEWSIEEYNEDLPRILKLYGERNQKKH